ncbi:MAG: family 1 glycosylhydrolase, partial [Thermoprotei archaeon]
MSVIGTHFVFTNGTYVTFHGLDYMGLELHPAFYNQTPQDFEIMGSWGFNIVRLPVDWSWIEPEPGEFNQSYLDQVKKVVDMANHYGIYVVID